MRLHAAPPWLGSRQAHFGHVSPVVPTSPRPCTQPARSVLAMSSKATSLGWDDLAHALPRANPEKRVVQDINFFQLVRDCPDWEGLQRLEGDLRDRYDRQPNLALAVLLRAAEVVDVEVATEGERRAVAKLLNSSIAPFIISKGVYSYKTNSLPSMLAGLAALQYSNTRLNVVLLKLLESSVDSLMLGQLCSALCSAAALKLRMDPELLDKVVARLDYTLKFCTAEDVGNLATALAPYTKLPPSAGVPFLSRLAARSQPFLEELSGEQLVDVLVLFVRQDFPLTSTWVSSFQTALIAALPGLVRPKSYAALLFSLAKGSLAISEGFLSALLNRLVAPATPGAVHRIPAATSSDTVMSRMRPGDLAVVAAVLSIYGYTPPEPWCSQYVAALERRAGEMDAKQVVTIVDTCVELDISLSADLLDELLAVAEGGLEALPAGRLQQLVSALEAVEHRPDGPWMRRLTAALVAAAGRSKGAELADVVAVLPHAPYAYGPDSEGAASVLAAVKARASELKGLDAATRGSILQSLKTLEHPGAAAFADSLAAPPPPAPAVAAAAAAPKRPVPPTQQSRPPAAAAATASKAAAAAVSGPRTSAPAAPAVPAEARQPATAAPAPARTQRASTPSPPQDLVVGSTRAFGRRRSIDYDDDEGEQEDEYDDDEDLIARRRHAAAASGRVPPTAPPPQPPPAAFTDGGVGGDGGFVASTRGSRRR